MSTRLPKRKKKRRKLDTRIEDGRKRCARLRTADLYEWAEQSQYVYGRCVADSRTTTEPVTIDNMLEEAKLAAEIMRVIVDELQQRTIR